MTIVSSDCTLELTCVPMDGESVVQTRDLGLCDPNENKECVPDGDGIYGCVCKEGYDSTPNGCELIGTIKIEKLNSVSSQCRHGESSIVRKPEVHPKFF